MADFAPVALSHADDSHRVRETWARWTTRDIRVLLRLTAGVAILAALGCVDYVTIFDDLTPRSLIARVLPQVLAKGADWGPAEVVGREEVEAAGGRVVSIPVVPGFSTSALIAAAVRRG